MKEFRLNSGTSVAIDDTKVIILRNEDKGISKKFVAGRAKGEVVIRLSTISSLIIYGDYLLVCGLGLPTPKEFSSSNLVQIKQYPNCIVGSEEEIRGIFEYLKKLL